MSKQNDHKKEDQKKSRDSLKATLDTYTAKTNADRVNKSMVALAKSGNITDEVAIDSYWFVKLNLHTEKAFGEFKSIKEYAEKLITENNARVEEKGFDMAKAIDKFRGDLRYRKNLGAVLLGKVEAKRTSTPKSPFQKIETIVNKQGGELQGKEAEKLITMIAGVSSFTVIQFDNLIEGLEDLQSSRQAMENELLKKAA